jgi:heme/copper-type cytochrome/quinol oxidase subunit 2
MKAIVDLFSTDYGLMSIAVILFVIFMSIWFSRFFKRKMDEAAQEQKRLAAQQRSRS